MAQGPRGRHSNFPSPPVLIGNATETKVFLIFSFYISLNATLCFVIQQLSLLFVLLLSCYTFWRWKCIFKMKNVNQWQIMKKMWQHYVGNLKVCEKECENCKKCEENVRNLFSIDWKLFVDGPADWCCFSFLTSISAPTLCTLPLHTTAHYCTQLLLHWNVVQCRTTLLLNTQHCTLLNIVQALDHLEHSTNCRAHYTNAQAQHHTPFTSSTHTFLQSLIVHYPL